MGNLDILKRHNMLPLNFFVIGVPKSGTTSLYEYLRLHPEIYLPAQKELHFFTNERLLENISGPGDKDAISSVVKSYEDYYKLYNEAQSEQVTGDISPSYFYFIDDFISNLKDIEHNHVKIIICLRDPINRAISNYRHKRRLVLEKLAFHEAIEKEEERKVMGYGDFWRYKDHSLYSKKLKKVLDYFGKENVKVILFEDLTEETAKTCEDIFQFLGVNNKFAIKNSTKVFNKGGSYKQNIFTKYLLKPSRVKRILYNIFPSIVIKSYNYFKKGITEYYQREEEVIEEKTRKYLVRFFKEDVNILEKDFGIDTSKWQRYD
tara:strand:- start:4078 stop:5034 length:957 start_codon:yes stop_codon:yes gene_type:complete